MSLAPIFGSRNCELLVTFFDGGNPLIVEAFRKAGMPDKTKGFSYHKFNNCALYARRDGGMSLNQISWEMGSAYFNTFFVKLQEMLDKILNKIEQVEQPIDDWLSFITFLNLRNDNIHKLNSIFKIQK